MTDLLPRYAQELKAAGYSPRTIRSRLEFLARADTQLLPYGLDEASRGELADLMATDGWKPWTRSTYWAHLWGYYSWAVQTDELTLNPMTKMKRPKAGDAVPSPATEAEVRAALALSQMPWSTGVLLGVYAGLRAGEMVALDRQDVTEQSVHVRQGKGDRDRFVPTHPALWEGVRYLRPGPLIPGRDGQRMSAKAWINGQTTHWRRIGLPDMHWHALRHYFATSLLANGVDIRIVQELMGHRSIISTQGYTQVTSRQRSVAVHALPIISPGCNDLGTANAIQGTGPASR